MALDDLTTLRSIRTTRRAVLATGTKLTYTAPLVAVTLRLSAGGAVAVSGGAPYCFSDEQYCYVVDPNDDPSCGDATEPGGGGCYYVCGVEGNVICKVEDNGRHCTADSDCDPGWVCGGCKELIQYSVCTLPCPFPY